jgi:hypothetical protein
MSPQDALKRANAAGQLFQNPLMAETLDFMEKEVMEAWMACPVRDVEAREALWRMAVTTRKFRDLLRGTMESGKIAAEQIRQQEESLAARASRAVANFRR